MFQDCSYSLGEPASIHTQTHGAYMLIEQISRFGILLYHSASNFISPYCKLCRILEVCNSFSEHMETFLLVIYVTYKWCDNVKLDMSYDSLFSWLHNEITGIYY